MNFVACRHKDIVLSLLITLCCFAVFSVYGWLEFTARFLSVQDAAKQWSRNGAKCTGRMIEKIGDKKTLFSRKYRQVTEEEKYSRFAVRNSRKIDVPLFYPEYLNILLARVFNDIEIRYTNEKFGAIIIDSSGYVPTGEDFYTGGESVRGLYTGDNTADATNYSHRFIPFISDIDKIINSIFEHDGKGYVGSQIVSGKSVWGYFIISFDISSLKIARDEIVRRILIVSLLFGAIVSAILRRFFVD